MTRRPQEVKMQKRYENHAEREEKQNGKVKKGKILSLFGIMICAQNAFEFLALGS